MNVRRTTHPVKQPKSLAVFTKISSIGQLKCNTFRVFKIRRPRLGENRKRRKQSRSARVTINTKNSDKNKNDKIQPKDNSENIKKEQKKEHRIGERIKRRQQSRNAMQNNPNQSIFRSYLQQETFAPQLKFIRSDKLPEEKSLLRGFNGFVDGNEMKTVSSSTNCIRLPAYFVSHRGRCQEFQRDHGGNRLGTQNEPNTPLRMVNDKSFQDTLYSFVAAKQIQFCLIFPRSPHTGDLWEIVVKSTKFHMAIDVESVNLIKTIMTKTPMPEPNGPTALTSSHFTLGRSLMAVYEPNCTNTNPLRWWQLLQCVTHRLWKYWSGTYPTSPQSRTTGTDEPTVFRVGMLGIWNKNFCSNE
jgi:hypothetical protein